jgi:hypothetical protein
MADSCIVRFVWEWGTWGGGRDTNLTLIIFRVHSFGDRSDCLYEGLSKEDGRTARPFFSGSQEPF